jgi:putative two-component system response regulator
MTPDIDTILVIDGSSERRHLQDLLSSRYRVVAASNQEEGLRLANCAPHPDLILLDVADGYAVLGRLRRDLSHIPVILLLDAAGDVQKFFDAGAADYVSKPVRPSELILRVGNQLEIKKLRDRMAALEADVTRQSVNKQFAAIVSIRALTRLTEIKDSETGNHILRTQRYLKLLANILRNHPRFSAVLTDGYIDLLVQSAPLHDIGKVGIPDRILLKPGKLTEEEWIVMKTHAKLGSDVIEAVERDIGRPVEFLAIAKEIARWHHEKWDGSGYPDSLVGETIPLSARLMALADVFDALVSQRVYKEHIPFEKARRIIESDRGVCFDPDVTDAFLDHFESFTAIAARYRD